MRKLRRFKAIHAGRRFFHLLHNNPAGTSRITGLWVHSIFSRAVNLRWEDSLLSLVQKGMGNASSFLVVDLPENLSFSALGLARGTPVNFNGACLDLAGVLSIDCRKLSVWQGRSGEELGWSGKNVPTENLWALKEAIERWGVRAGTEHTVSSRLMHAVNCLHGAIGRKSETDWQRAVYAMLGYGPGLTPSGDDVLLGFLAAAHSGLEYVNCLPYLHQAIKENLRCTTDVSAGILRQALTGEFHEYLQEVLYAVIKRTPEDVAVATKNLLSLGATSGTAIATGIYLALYWGSGGGFLQQGNWGKEVFAVVG